MKRVFTYIATLLLMIGAGHPAAALDTNVFEDVQIHGFISQGFLYSDEYNYLSHKSTDGSFEYNEMGINFSKNLSDKLRMGMQFFSRDLGDAGNNKVTLDWAYGDYRFEDWLGIRAGKIKLPRGLYNETRDVDMLRTSIVMPQGIYNDLLRDTTIALSGIGVYGNAGLGSAGHLEYQIIAGSFSNDNESGLGKFVDNGVYGVSALNDEIEYDTGYCGALRWETPLDGLRLAYSYYTTKADFPMTLATSLGGADYLIAAEYAHQTYSIEYSWQNLLLAFEYQARDTDATTFGQTRSTEAEIYYLSASYRFNDWFTLGSYYSVTYPDKDDKKGDHQVIDHKAWEKDLALSLRFDINECWVFKVEGHHVSGTYNVMFIDNRDSDFAKEDWNYGAAKLTFNF